MEKKFSLYGINLTEKQKNLFDKYYDILIEYNNKFNITAITEKEEVIIKHFAYDQLTYLIRTLDILEKRFSFILLLRKFGD
mgnify:CR=1 FL=1